MNNTIAPHHFSQKYIRECEWWRVVRAGVTIRIDSTLHYFTSHPNICTVFTECLSLLSFSIYLSLFLEWFAELNLRLAGMEKQTQHN